VLAEQNLRSNQRNSIIRTNPFVHPDLDVFDAGFAAGQVRAGAADFLVACDAKARFP
jgi:hypothetical protein